MEDNVIEIQVEKVLITARGPLTLKIEVRLNLGELTVLFGESGVGKTTLLRMLAGLTNPDKGLIKVGQHIWFDTRNKINLPPQKRSIGFMFQDYALFPNMTVFENIRFASGVDPKDGLMELIEAFGLAEFAHRKPEKLSGGQKQRVALARALARKPSVLLLDEPLSALDAKTRTALQGEILKAHKLHNTTTLMVSHDLSEVFRLAQQVIRIEHGRVVAQGKPDEIFIDSHISGKVQMTGTIVRIEQHDTYYLLSVVTGLNQLIKVTAYGNDIENLHEGDQVMVFTKAFNPMVIKV